MSVLKLIWRIYHRILYKKRGVIISRGATFNQRTIFGTNIRIHPGAIVSDSVIGDSTYIGGYAELRNCIIGKYCSIAAGIRVLRGNHPTRKFVSTSPVLYSTQGQCPQYYVNHNCFEEHKEIEGRNIIIGNDVWIASNVTFLSGVRIGDGAVIAAGAVVTKDVPPYAIIGGVPAKVIRFRFENEQIKKLLSIKWWDRSEDWIKTHVNDFLDIDLFLQKNK